MMIYLTVARNIIYVQGYHTIVMKQWLTSIFSNTLIKCCKEIIYLVQFVFYSSRAVTR